MTDAERKELSSLLEKAAGILTNTPLDRRLLQNGWTKESANGISSYFRQLRRKIDAGWEPSHMNGLNMAHWLDDVGVMFGSSDVLQEAVYEASNSFNRLLADKEE